MQCPPTLQPEKTERFQNSSNNDHPFPSILPRTPSPDHLNNNILCCVDVYSRFAICRALTNRKISNIVEKLEEMFKEIGFPKNINCDQEFNVKEVNEFAKRHNITMWYSQPYEINKNAIVERFNRTLANYCKTGEQPQKNTTGIECCLTL